MGPLPTMGPVSTPYFASCCLKSSSVRSVTSSSSSSSARGLSVFLVAFCGKRFKFSSKVHFGVHTHAETHSLFQSDFCWSPPGRAGLRRWRRYPRVGSSCCSARLGSSNKAARTLLFCALRWEAEHCWLPAHSSAYLSSEPTDLREILPWWT